MSVLQVAVIGAGHLGRIHARLLKENPQAALVAVVDPDPHARHEVSQALQVAAVPHHQELMGRIDAAIIATPTIHHHTVSRELLQQGVHLLVEKPFTTTVAEADELLAIADRQHRVIQVGHVERFNPAFVAARPHLRQICYVEAVRTSGYACRSTDIGVVLDLMIHDLDIALAVVNSPVVQVQASGAVIIGPHEDLAEARLTFANGCVANLSASRISYQTQRQLRFFGRESFATLDLGQKTAQLVRPSARLIHGVNVDQLTREQREHLKTQLFQDYLPITPLEVVDRNAIADEQRDFLSSIAHGHAPQVSGHVAREVLAVANQIQDAIARFRATQLPVVPEIRKAG